MRITFILPYPGLAGGIRVVAIYAAKLKKRGHKVTVVSIPRVRPSLKQKVKRLVTGKGLPWHTEEPSHFDGLDVEHVVIDKQRPIVNEDVPDADVVIATWWKTAEWVSALHASKGKKYYFVQGHEVVDWLPIDRVKATYRMPIKKITISQWLVDVLKKEYGNTNVALVPNSVDIAFFNSGYRNRQKNPTVGFVYSTDACKGCDTVISAIETVLQKQTNLRVRAFGSCRKADKLPLPYYVEYHYQPPQETIREIYASCDYWLFGSIAEGFGLPILEAMACKTPVIATPAGAAPELIANGGGGASKRE